MKLVQPSLTDKQQNGAVITGLSSVTHIRKAYQSLLELSKIPGQPKSLGILVARQITFKYAFWVQFIQNKTLGAILIIGRGSDKTKQRLTAFPVSAKSKDIIRILNNALFDFNKKDMEQLTDAILKLCLAAKTLQPGLFTFEIHPLVIQNKGPALILDALIGIGDQQKLN